MLWKGLFLSFLSFSLINCGNGKRTSYYGFKVFEIRPSSQQEVDYLLEIYHNSQQDLDFWKVSKDAGESWIIAVAPKQAKPLVKILNRSIKNWQIIIQDLGFYLLRKDYSGSRYAFSLTQYNRYDQIIKWLQSTADACGENCFQETIGQTFEGRKLKVIKIGKPQKDPTIKKPEIFIDAGIHAREWIAPATALQIINRLVQQNDNDTKQLLEKYDFYVLPLLNPDGYEYSHTNKRLWRKNRSPHKDKAWLGTCYGVDLNRNFDIDWGRIGTSKYCPSDIYGGPGPFSEFESKAIRDFLRDHNKQLKAYVTLHCSGQLWLVPYGYTYDERKKFPEDYKELLAAAKVGAAALKKVRGTKYTVGNTADVLYPCSGASDDYAKKIEGVKYVYTFELPPKGSFVYPPSNIKVTGEETYKGIVAFLKHIG